MSSPGPSRQWIISAEPETDARELEQFLLDKAFAATKRASLTRVTRGTSQTLSSAEAPGGGTHFLWGVDLDLMNDSATTRIFQDVEDAMRAELESRSATLSAPLTTSTPEAAAADA